MTNLLQDSAAWLGRQLKKSTVAGRAVSVQQGSTIVSTDPDGVQLYGVLVTADYEIVDQNGFLVKVKSHDWTFAADDLGSLVLRNGAIVIEGDSRYEAMDLGGSPAAERLDASGVLITLHTKEVSIVT